MNPQLCYLCESSGFEQLLDHTRDNEKVSVKKCLNCGLVTLSSYDHLQSDFYETRKMHEWNNEKWSDWVKETKEDDFRRVNQLEPLLNECNLLDFGCGNCGFLLQASSVSNRSIGIEPDRTFEDHIGKDLESEDISVYANLSELPVGVKFNVITMFHVIEHLVDPIPTLEKLRDLLTEDGVLIIETPNANDALLTLYNCEAFKEFTYWSCHARLYTDVTLGMLLEKVGLRGKADQIQRYPLSNHLYWLSKGKPGGHHVWKSFNKADVIDAYQESLAKQRMCDTLLGVFEK